MNEIFTIMLSFFFQIQFPSKLSLFTSMKIFRAAFDMNKIPDSKFKFSKSSLKPFIVPLNYQRSFATTRSTKVTRSSNSEVFYSLAEQEAKVIRFDRGAMKKISSEMHFQLKSDKNGYLTERYNERPASRFNFPEATSFRYGWFN